MPTGLPHAGPAGSGRTRRGGRLRPVLIADHPALDVLDSNALPGGAAVEFIAKGDGLLRWPTAAALIGPSSAGRLRKGPTVAALDRTAREAAALREWFREVVRRSPAQAQDGGRLKRLRAARRRAVDPGLTITGLPRFAACATGDPTQA